MRNFMMLFIISILFFTTGCGSGIDYSKVITDSAYPLAVAGIKFSISENPASATEYQFAARIIKDDVIPLLTAEVIDTSVIEKAEELIKTKIKNQLILASITSFLRIGLSGIDSYIEGKLEGNELASNIVGSVVYSLNKFVTAVAEATATGFSTAAGTINDPPPFKLIPNH